MKYVHPVEVEGSGLDAASYCTSTDCRVWKSNGITVTARKHSNNVGYSAEVEFYNVDDELNDSGNGNGEDCDDNCRTAAVTSADATTTATTTTNTATTAAATGVNSITTTGIPSTKPTKPTASSQQQSAGPTDSCRNHLPSINSRIPIDSADKRLYYVGTGCSSLIRCTTYQTCCVHTTYN